MGCPSLWSHYTILGTIYQLARRTNIVPDICARCILYPIYKTWYNEENKKDGDTMPASKAQQKAVSKYMKANYDEIKVRIPKGQKEAVQACAQSKGESVNALIWGLLQEAMGVDKTVEDSENY